MRLVKALLAVSWLVISAILAASKSTWPTLGNVPTLTTWWTKSPARLNNPPDQNNLDQGFSGASTLLLSWFLLFFKVYASVSVWVCVHACILEKHKSVIHFHFQRFNYFSNSLPSGYLCLSLLFFAFTFPLSPLPLVPFFLCWGTSGLDSHT